MFGFVPQIEHQTIYKQVWQVEVSSFDLLLKCRVETIPYGLSNFCVAEGVTTELLPVNLINLSLNSDANSVILSVNLVNLSGNSVNFDN